MEKEDMLLKFCIDLWKKYTELKKLTARSIGSYCLRLVKTSFLALKRFKMSQANCKTLIYERNFNIKRTYWLNWLHKLESNNKAAGLVETIENIRKYRSYHQLKAVYRESLE